MWLLKRELHSDGKQLGHEDVALCFVLVFFNLFIFFLNQPVELLFLNKSKIDTIILRCCQVVFLAVVGFLCPYLLFCIDTYVMVLAR